MMPLTSKQRVSVLEKMDPDQRLETYVSIRNRVDRNLQQDVGYHFSDEYDRLLDELQDYWTAMTEEERIKAQRQLTR